MSGPSDDDVRPADLVEIGCGDRVFRRPGDGAAMLWENSGEHVPILCGMCRQIMPYDSLMECKTREVADRNPTEET